MKPQEEFIGLAVVKTFRRSSWRKRLQPARAFMRLARELVERGRAGESADAIWADLTRERAQQMLSQMEPDEEGDPSLPLLPQEPVAASLPVPHLVQSNAKSNRSLPRFGPPATRRESRCCSSPEPLHVSL